MSAPRRSFCLIPGVLALMLSGCTSLSEPVQQPPQTAGMSVPSPAAEREKAEAEREAVEYQTQVAQMRIAGNFCADERKLTEYAYLYLKRQPLPLPPQALSMEQARCASRTFLKGIIPSAGRIVGYKSEQMPMSGEDGQQKMVAVRGNLLERMLLPNGVALSASRYATQPRMKATVQIGRASCRERV